MTATIEVQPVELVREGDDIRLEPRDEGQHCVLRLPTDRRVCQLVLYRSDVNELRVACQAALFGADPPKSDIAITTDGDAFTLTIPTAPTEFEVICSGDELADLHATLTESLSALYRESFKEDKE